MTVATINVRGNNEEQWINSAGSIRMRRAAPFSPPRLLAHADRSPGRGASVFDGQ
jgi:hypothetical protein